MEQSVARVNKKAVARPAPQFTPWPTEALLEQDRPTQPTPITERLPQSAPARLLPQPDPALWSRGGRRLPVLVGAGGLLLVLLVLGSVLVAQGGAAPRRYFAVTGGPPAPAQASAAGASGTTAAATDLSGFSAADLLPQGVPIKRTDWVITKDYAAHGGNDPVARQKWGAVDFAFWHNKDALGAEIIATHAGKIKLLQDYPTYGNLVYVQGPHYTTTYGHMERFNVQVGQIVRRGDVIGFMGSTGHSSGPHVDYQVWQDGQNQNPMNYCQCGMQGSPEPPR